tara:strand:- start:157 stop:1005 length:849 start_codon:yes stop_codon:yes gene_type:complete
MKPVLKWVGGKTRLMKKIKEVLPDKIRNYHEPFFGGGSVLFSLEDKITGRIYINDYNKDLINVYKNIRKNPRELISKLKLLKRAYLKSKDKRAFYNKKRKNLNENKTFNSRRAALYIFINKTNFNGIMIKDKNDKIVSGWGQHEKPEIFKVSNIMKVSSFLNTRNVIITNLDYEKSLKKAKKGDFVFMDPPYVPDDITLWKDRYLKQRWTTNDFERTFDVLEQLTKRGCLVMFANSLSSMIRRRFSKDKRFKMLKVPIKRTISRNKKARVIKHEVLILNYKA